MSTEHNQPDQAVDKVLAALRDAVPPQGMEARIAQRLAQQPTPSHSKALRLPNLLAGSTLAGAWWRGAASGAAAAMAAVALVLVAGHLLRATPDRTQAARDGAGSRTPSPSVRPTRASDENIPGESRANPCARPTVLRADAPLPTPSAETLRAESYAENAAPSRPAPVMPLTAQERELVKLVRTADPKQLDTLNPETQAKLEAENAADFAKFFAHPPPPPQPAPEARPDANLETNQEASPAGKPESGPETNPEAVPEENPEANPDTNQASPKANPDTNPPTSPTAIE